MANTREIWILVEPYVRKELGKLYPEHSFAEKSLRLGRKRDGSFATHNFDAVSEDGTIVATIKSGGWQTSGGKNPSGKIGQIFQSLYFLGLVDAEVKLLVLTDEEAYQGFSRGTDGKLAKDVQVTFIPLTTDLESTVDRIRQKASQEMRRP